MIADFWPFNNIKVMCIYFGGIALKNSIYAYYIYTCFFFQFCKSKLVLSYLFIVLWNWVDYKVF